MSLVEITADRLQFGTRVSIDGRDITSDLTRVEFSADAREPNTARLHMLAAATVIRAESDVVYDVELAGRRVRATGPTIADALRRLASRVDHPRSPRRAPPPWRRPR